MSEATAIGTRIEMFVDDFLVDRMENLRRDLKHPERREISLVCDDPWETDTAFFNSVVTDGDLIRLHYRAGIPNLAAEDYHVLALAESSDGGVTFRKPNLGLVEFNGSRKNNILAIGDPPRIPPAFIDTNPDSKLDERYKGVSSRSALADRSKHELYAMCSADGVRWRMMSDTPLNIRGPFDTINTVRWDSHEKCYRMFTRFTEFLPEDRARHMPPGMKYAAVRKIRSCTSADFLNWSEPVLNEYDDAEDQMQFYTNAALPCPGAEHIYLAFPNRFVEYRVQDPAHAFPGANDAVFMTSRDRVHWKRYMEAWVRPGPDPLNWTDRNNYPTWGIVQNSATEWSMYISEHFRHGKKPVRMRRLSLRPYGFVSINAGFSAGELLTKPLCFSGKELRLNYSTSAEGGISVGIADEGGRDIEGFSIDECVEIFGDRIDGAVSWKQGVDVGKLAGRPVRLRFVMRDADLYSLQFV